MKMCTINKRKKCKFRNPRLMCAKDPLVTSLIKSNIQIICLKMMIGIIRLIQLRRQPTLQEALTTWCTTAHKPWQWTPQLRKPQAAMNGRLISEKKLKKTNQRLGKLKGLENASGAAKSAPKMLVVLMIMRVIWIRTRERAMKRP